MVGSASQDRQVLRDPLKTTCYLHVIGMSSTKCYGTVLSNLRVVNKDSLDNKT